MIFCCVPDCFGSLHAGGYCSKHWQRLKAHGTTDPSPRSARALAIEVLWLRLSDVDAVRPGECWEWPASLNEHGYGTTKRNGQNLAHRAAWVEVYDEIPVGQIVCHRCDNPPCIRPSHLFLGTARDNTSDMFAKGRARPPRSLANGRAKLSDDDVQSIRADAADGCSYATIAAAWGLNPANVGRIVRRECRTDVGDATPASEEDDQAVRDYLRGAS